MAEQKNAGGLPTGEAMSAPAGGPVSTNVTSTARLDLFEHLGE